MLKQQENWPAILAIILSIGIYGVVQSLTYPLLAILLASRDYSGWQVGFNAAMMPVGMLVAAVFAPRLVAKFGIYRVIQYGLAGVSICMTLIYILEDYILWMIIRFFSGVLLTLIFVATDSCINDLAEDRVRGRIVGLYSVSLSFGFILGPLVLTLFDSRSLVPFLFAILLPFAMMIMIHRFRADIVALDFSNEPVGMLGFFRKIPVMIVAVVFIAFADQAALSLLPLFGLGYGRSEAEASFLVVAMTAGSFLLLYPISWLADSVPRLGLMTACAGGAALLSFGIILMADRPMALVFAVFVWGGVYYSIYSLTLVRIGQMFSKSDLVGATAACGAAWGIGGIIGTPGAGAAMDLMGPAGLFASIGALFTLLTGAFALVMYSQAGTADQPARSETR